MSAEDEAARRREQCPFHRQGAGTVGASAICICGTTPPDLDDALCDALMAARHGKYDGMTAEAHLEHLIDRVRAYVTPPDVSQP